MKFIKSKKLIIIIFLLSTFVVVNVVAFNSYYLNLKSVKVLSDYFSQRNDKDCKTRATILLAKLEEYDQTYLTISNQLVTNRDSILNRNKELDTEMFNSRINKYDEVLKNYNTTLSNLMDNATLAIALKDEKNCSLEKFNKYELEVKNSAASLTNLEQNLKDKLTYFFYNGDSGYFK